MDQLTGVHFTTVISIKQLKTYVKQSGVKIFAAASLTRDDELCIEVKKSHFLKTISQWPDDALTDKNSKVIIDSGGDVIYG